MERRSRITGSHKPMLALADVGAGMLSQDAEQGPEIQPPLTFRNTMSAKDKTDGPLRS